jgi:hypothetical protein
MIQTAEEFFEQHIQRGVNNTHTMYLNTAIEFARLHVKAALDAADAEVPLPYSHGVINAYPPENIT